MDFWTEPFAVTVHLAYSSSNYDLCALELDISFLCLNLVSNMHICVLLC